MKNNIFFEGALTHDTLKIINDNIVDQAVCTATLTVTSSTTLANIVGLQSDQRSDYYLKAGKQYKFRACLAGVSDASGGYKIALAQLNGLTLSQLQVVSTGYTAAAEATQNSTSTTSGASLFTAEAAYIKVEMEGTFTVLTSGTVQLQMAQNTSDATASTILVGSTMEITPMANGADAP